MFVYFARNCNNSVYLEPNTPRRSCPVTRGKIVHWMRSLTSLPESRYNRFVVLKGQIISMPVLWTAIGIDEPILQHRARWRKQSKIFGVWCGNWIRTLLSCSRNWSNEDGWVLFILVRFLFLFQAFSTGLLQHTKEEAKSPILYRSWEFTLIAERCHVNEIETAIEHETRGSEKTYKELRLRGSSI